MAEPPDPAARCVASALKSLRTRAGLREERLHGTELALDTLTGMDCVPALVNAGNPGTGHRARRPRGRRQLEPTMSIIADASLGLELSAGLVPDTDLYAHDLGQRRKALLRNWAGCMSCVRRPRVRRPRPARSGWKWKPRRSRRSRWC